MSEQHQRALDLQRRGVYDFLDAETIRLLSLVQNDEDLRIIQQRGLRAYEAATGKKVEYGSLELMRAATGLGLMLTLTEQEVATLDEQAQQIRALSERGTTE